MEVVGGTVAAWSPGMLQPEMKIVSITMNKKLRYVVLVIPLNFLILTNITLPLLLPILLGKYRRLNDRKYLAST
jgi:hypothetical protein